MITLTAHRVLPTDLLNSPIDVTAKRSSVRCDNTQLRSLARTWASGDRLGSMLSMWITRADVRSTTSTVTRR